jgi:hypothetical membrane protein
MATAAVVSAPRARRHGLALTTRGAAGAGLLGPALFGLTVLLLTVTQYDALLGLGWRPFGDSALPWPSALALGPYGWVQVANFVALGLLLLTFTAGLRRGLPAGRGVRAGPALLAVAGVGLVLLGFKTDPAPTPQSWHAWIHLGAFALTALAVLVACGVFWRLLRRDPRWRDAGRCSLVTAFLVLASLALPGAAGGYVFVFALLAWLELLACRLWVVADRPAAER